MPEWTPQERSIALGQYADITGSVVYDAVPVTQPGWRGWGTEVSTRYEAIALEIPGVRPRIAAYEELEFADRLALATATRIHPLLAWSYADRPGFGHLATRQAFFARTWHPEAPVQPVALVGAGKGNPNVAPVYYAAGYDIVELPGTPAARRAFDDGRGGAGRNDPWNNPQTAEDRMLRDMWERRHREGWWLAEVPVGFRTSPSESSARRIDAVVVESASPRVSAGGADLDDLRAAAGLRAEVVEAKNHRLRSDVVGQVLCARHMLEDSYPGLAGSSMTVCVRTITDDAMRWFCTRTGIRVEEVDGQHGTPTCPNCFDKAVVPVVYGLPTASLGESADRGEVVFGGCGINDGDPEWACTACDFRWTSQVT